MRKRKKAMKTKQKRGNNFGVVIYDKGEDYNQKRKGEKTLSG